MKQSYSGRALDGTVQRIGERPKFDERGKTVDATPREALGEVRAENLPVPELTDNPERPEHGGQTTFDNWGWSA